MNYIEQIIPHISSQSMDVTIDFMTDIFACESTRQSDSYCELTIGNHKLGILSSDGEPNQQSIYLQVKDVDSFWNDIKDKLEGHQQPPFDRDYGMREIHLIIPATATLLFIGSKI